MSKKKESGIPLIYLLIGVLLLSFLIPSPSGGTYGGDFWGFLTGLTTGGVGPAPGVTPYYGNVQFIINENDYLAGGAVTPTNAAYTMFHTQPTRGSAGLAITASGTTTEVPKSDRGIVWLTIYGGDDFYIVEDAFVNANPRVKQAYWSDYDTDGDDDYIVKIDISDVGVIGGTQTPSCVLALPLLDLDKSGLDDDNPSDISSIGTSEIVTQVTWKLSGITADDGVFLTRLFIATNDTREGEDVRCEQLTLSGGWVSTSGAKTFWASPVDHDDNTYTAWYVKPADYLEYHQGIRLWRDTNEADTLYISVNIRCTLETGNKITVDLYAYFVDPTGATASVNDQVVLSA